MNFFKFFDELTVSWCSFSVKTVPPLYFSLILIKQKDFLWQTVHVWILTCGFGSIWLKMKDIENNNTANFCEFIMNLFCNTTKKYLKCLKHLVCHQECIFKPSLTHYLTLCICTKMWTTCVCMLNTGVGLLCLIEAVGLVGR